MDSSSLRVTIVDLYVSDTYNARLTNAGFEITYDTNTYTDSDGMRIDLPTESTGFNDNDCLLENIKIEGTFLTYLSNRAPFSSVYVTIRELTLDDDLEVTDVIYLFKGLLCTAKPRPLSGYMDLLCKEWGYYTATVVNMPCSEQCAWLSFGSGGCTKTVWSEELEVESVDGLTLTFTSEPSDTTAYLFNKGYVEKDGMRIKIKYWATGASCQLSRGALDDWVGDTLTVYAGCDRTLSTCKNIHDNESEFLGLGYAMVDYNAFYENY